MSKQQSIGTSVGYWQHFDGVCDTQRRRIRSARTFRQLDRFAHEAREMKIWRHVSGECRAVNARLRGRDNPVVYEKSGSLVVVSDSRVISGVAPVAEHVRTLNANGFVYSAAHTREYLAEND